MRSLENRKCTHEPKNQGWTRVRETEIEHKPEKSKTPKRSRPSKSTSNQAFREKSKQIGDGHGVTSRASTMHSAVAEVVVFHLHSFVVLVRHSLVGGNDALVEALSSEPSQLVSSKAVSQAADCPPKAFGKR